MPGTPVEVRVGGYNYRVVSSAGEGEVRHFADIVETKLRALAPEGMSAHPQAILLAAIALAHDLEAERERRTQSESRYREKLAQVVGRIDKILQDNPPLDPPFPQGKESPPA